VKQIAGLIPNLKVKVPGSVLARGLPQPSDLTALDALAETIAGRHQTLGLAT
jgi:hypothetical protein